MQDFMIAAKWEVLAYIKVPAKNLKEALDKVQDVSPEQLQLYLKDASVIEGTAAACPEIMSFEMEENISGRIADIILTHPFKQQILDEIEMYADLLNPTPSDDLELFDKIFKRVSEKLFREIQAE